jgi:hypothetical protein
MSINLKRHREISAIPHHVGDSGIPTMDEMKIQLDSLGWKKYGGFSAWQAPDGRIFRGPYKAWCVATGKD